MVALCTQVRAYVPVDECAVIPWTATVSYVEGQSPCTVTSSRINLHCVGPGSATCAEPTPDTACSPVCAHMWPQFQRMMQA
jgi:hypothetical protein